MEATLWEMQNAGYGGSLEAHNSILDAYGKAGQLEKLEDALARMEKSGFRKDLASYNILINIFGRRTMIPEMEELFHNMKVSLSNSSSHNACILISAKLADSNYDRHDLNDPDSDHLNESML